MKCAWWRCGGGPSGRRELVRPEVPHWVADQALGVLAEGGHAAQVGAEREVFRRDTLSVVTAAKFLITTGSLALRRESAWPAWPRSSTCWRPRRARPPAPARPRSARTWPTTRCTARSRPGSPARRPPPHRSTRAPDCQAPDVTQHRQAAASGRDVAEEARCQRAVHVTAERLDGRVVPAEVHGVGQQDDPGAARTVQR